MGVAGHCFSEVVAMQIAATCGGRVHLLLPRIRARLYFGHAVKDPFMPESAIEIQRGRVSQLDGAGQSGV